MTNNNNNTLSALENMAKMSSDGNNKPLTFKIPIVDMCPEASLLQRLADEQFSVECSRTLEREKLVKEKYAQRKD